MFGQKNVDNYEDTLKSTKRVKPRVAEGVKVFHGTIKCKIFGFTIHISTGKQIGFIASFVMLVVMAFSLFATFSGINYNNNKINEYNLELESIKTKSELYLDIIAKSNNEELGYGTTTGEFKCQQIAEDTANIIGVYKLYSNAYSIKYKITVEGEIYFFETLAVYKSINEIKDKYTESSSPSAISGLDYVFKVAYKLNSAGKVEEAVNIDFNPSSGCGEDYYKAKIDSCEQFLDISNVSAVILVIITALVVALIVSLMVKVVKKSIRQNKIEKAKEEAAFQEFVEQEEMAERERVHANKTYRFCEYCGAKFSKEEDVCPSCGSVQSDL